MVLKTYGQLASSRGINLHFAYEWTASNYKNRIESLFPKTKFLKTSPFHVMTDILLVTRKVSILARYLSFGTYTRLFM